MNGLEQILLKIEDDNNAKIKNIFDESKAECDKYIEDVKKQADVEAEKIIETAQKKAKLISESAKSGCESYINKQILRAKTDVVLECIDYATKKIKMMDDKQYFEAIAVLIDRYAQNGEGELLMNSKDLERIPKGFIKKVNADLSDKNAKVKLCDTPLDIDSGFIIRYGGIEENCTFDALIDEKIDEIKDKLYEQLKA